MSLISDNFQGGSISDELNDFQSWMFIRLTFSRARSRNGLGFKCLVWIAVLLLNSCCYFISYEFDDFQSTVSDDDFVVFQSSVSYL